MTITIPSSREEESKQNNVITDHAEESDGADPTESAETEGDNNNNNFWSTFVDTSERKLVYFAPFLLSLVAIALSIYALVDFAAFVTDYRQLEKEVEAQSRSDFELLTETTLELFQLLLEVGVGLCGDNTANAFSFQRSLDLVEQLAGRLARVTMAVLPSGPIWSDYFIKRFPAQDGYDYSHFANPSRIVALFLYGVPNMEPLFRTFAASLFFDIISIVLIFVPIVLNQVRKPTENTLRAEKIMLGIDAMFLVVSIALLARTIKLVDTMDGYDVETVKGQALFLEATTVDPKFKEMIDLQYWGQIPERYCRNTINPCHNQDASYQKNCSLANIDIFVPKEYVVEKDNQWFVDMDITGYSLFERNALRGYEGLFDESGQVITDFLNFTFAYLLTSIPEQYTTAWRTVTNGMIAGACPAGEQEFFWTNQSLASIQFPSDDPDYDLICNADCKHDWTLEKRIELEDWRKLPPEDFTAACNSNCHTVDTSECGCGSFSMGAWKYNCTTSMPAITAENYAKFTEFAVENIREGLKFDIAATAIDVIAICIGAIILLIPSIRKWVRKDDSHLFPDESAKEFKVDDQSSHAMHEESTWFSLSYHTLKQQSSNSVAIASKASQEKPSDCECIHET